MASSRRCSSFDAVKREIAGNEMVLNELTQTSDDFSRIISRHDLTKPADFVEPSRNTASPSSFIAAPRPIVFEFDRVTDDLAQAEQRQIVLKSDLRRETLDST